MFGAVQLGVLAACVVVLVPMALAGWHLSRNKVLFFSGALFISLAVTVHLSPYFPSLTDFFPTVSTSSSSSSALVVLENRDSCLAHLHRIKWKNNHVSNLNLTSTWKWVLSDKNVLACDFQKLGRNDAGDLLNGSWVMVVGDSQARLFVVALLNLMLFEEEMVGVRGDLFKRHSDYHLVVDRVGLKLDFIWAPYVNNLTHLVMELNRNHSFPDVLVMGSGLWHMLHVNNSTHYDASLQLLSRSMMPLLVGKSQPHLFWLGMPTLINSMLNTEEKREKMTSAAQFAYDLGLRGSKLLRPGGPFVLLDIKSLTENCGESCTVDGMHYDGVVYEAAVHIMLNALLIQSQQKL
ncbi:N-acetylneuraminate 9-O-acetyltransferase [Bienertia sinuspersici]